MNEKKDCASHPEMLDVVKRDADFVLYAGGVPVLTPEGGEMAHHNPRLPELLLREMTAGVQSAEDPITAYQLFRLTQQRKARDADPVLTHWDALLQLDPMIQKPTVDAATNNDGEQAFMLDLMENNQSNLTFFFNGLANAVKCFNNFLLDYSEGHFDFSRKSTDHISQIIQTAYTELADEEAAAIQLLCTGHDCGIILPLLLVLRQLTASEYANALFGIHHPQKRQAATPSLFTPYLLTLDNTTPTRPDWQNANQSFQHLRTQAWTLLDYLMSAEPIKGSTNVRDLINQGEHFTTEFKTTLRWNVKSDKKDIAMEHASLKTINAFLNSAGGCLLIGVRDDGSIAGLDMDHFPNADRYALHFWNLIKASMGQDVAPFIHGSFESIHDKNIFVVQCKRSSKPVFLHQKGFDEEFFIRVGPSSAKLSVREALSYINGRFEESIST